MPELPWQYLNVKKRLVSAALSWADDVIKKQKA